MQTCCRSKTTDLGRRPKTHLGLGRFTRCHGAPIEAVSDRGAGPPHETLRASAMRRSCQRRPPQKEVFCWGVSAFTTIGLPSGRQVWSSVGRGWVRSCDRRRAGRSSRTSRTVPMAILGHGGREAEGTWVGQRRRTAEEEGIPGPSFRRPDSQVWIFVLPDLHSERRRFGWP